MRAALITGAASGIGRAVARELFSGGSWNLFLLDRDRRGLEVLRNELEPPDGASPALGPGKVRIVACDLAAAGEVTEALASLGSELKAGGVQLLVNSAGVTHAGLFSRMRTEDFERVIGTNLLGAVRVTHAVLPHLRPADGGRELPTIVNVASLAGLVGAPGMSAYSASKFGLVGFSDALRLELRGRARVCVACPGFVRTGIVEHALGGAPGQRRGMAGILERFGTSAERAARGILRAVRDGQRTALINPEARFFRALSRLSPAACEGLVGAAYARLKETGVIPEENADG